MQGAEEPLRMPRNLFTFHSQQDIQQFATGCDADIGGTSTVRLDLDDSRKDASGQYPTGKFWGEMRLGVRSGLEGKLRGGYAGFRNKVRVARNSCFISSPLNPPARWYPAPPNAIWASHGRRLQSSLLGTPPTPSGRSIHLQLILRQYPNRRTHIDGLVAAPTVLPTAGQYMGRHIRELF